MVERFRVVRLDDRYLQNEELLREFGSFLRESRQEGEALIVVHGGFAEVFQHYNKAEQKRETDSHFTMISDRNIPFFTMVLAGEVNKRLVRYWQQEGLSCLGLCGCDFNLLRSNFLNYQHLGRIGGPPRVNVDAFQQLAATGGVLVVAPVCAAPDGNMLFLDPDSTAHSIATALRSDSLMFVIEEPGLCVNGESLQKVTRTEVEGWMEQHFAGTHFVPILQTTLAALNDDVTSVMLGNPESLSKGEATIVSR
ncbi:MAG: hypothetical protein EP343_25945 [Deltaproteobacteria bacterium]|nr:MAG: hypothetical protein EP343_25945 [Deltaproteobacteria bacterium]